MKTLLTFLLLIASSTLLSSCVTKVNEGTPLNEQELELVKQVIGESTSINPDGITSSFFDATTSLSRDGFINSSFLNDPKSDPSFSPDAHISRPPQRGNNSDINVSFDPKTGIHRVKFRRFFDAEQSRKELLGDLTYIYRNAEGRALTFPRVNQRLVSTIDHISIKKGTIKSMGKESSFERIDSLQILGIDSSSDRVRIRGTHTGTGTMKIILPSRGEEVQRSFMLRYRLRDVTMQKTTIGVETTLSNSITGYLDWTLTTTTTLDGNRKETTTRGTTEVSENGVGLLRMRNLTDLIRFDLINGEEL